MYITKALIFCIMSVTHTLTFPSSWMAKPLLPPCAQEGKLSHNVIAWLKEHGLVPSDKVLHHLKAMDIDTYGGYSCPKASEKAIFVWTCYVTLWLLWDDVDVEKNRGIKGKEVNMEAWMKESTVFFTTINEQAGEVLSALHASVTKRSDTCASVAPVALPSSLQEMVRGVRGDAISKDNAFNLAWRDLGQELRKEGCSDTFMARLAHNMHFWLQYTLGESEFCRELGVYPRDTLSVAGDQTSNSAYKVRGDNILTHLFRRIITIGVYPSCQLLEYTCGFEFTVEEYTDKHVVQMNILAAILIALANEVYSVGKDFKGNWANVVLMEHFRATASSAEVSRAISNGAGVFPSKGPAFVPSHVKVEESKSAPADLERSSHREEKSVGAQLEYMCRLNDEAIKFFDNIAMEYFRGASFAAMSEDKKDKVRKWVQAVRYCASGFSMWHSVCPRYKKDLLYEKGMGIHVMQWKVVG